MAKTLKTVLKLDMSKFKAGLRNSVVATKQFERSIQRPLGGAIRKVAKLTAMFATMGAVVLGAGIKMSGSIEMLAARLENISAGPADFAQSWKDATNIFLTSPLELGETIEALALLKATYVPYENSTPLLDAKVLNSLTIGSTLGGLGNKKKASALLYKFASFLI